MKNLRKILVLSLLSCGLAGCGGQTVIRDSESAANSASNAKKELSFVDFDTFDQELSSALNAGAEVTVTFAAPASIDKIPPRISTWLSTVQKSSGAVETAPQPKSRALFSVLLPLIPQAYSYLKDKALYSPAENYDVAIPYNSADGRIQKMVFKNKNAIAAGSQTP